MNDVVNWLLWCLVGSWAAAVLCKWTCCQLLCSQAWLYLQFCARWPLITVLKVQAVHVLKLLRHFSSPDLTLSFYVYCKLGSLNQYLMAGCSVFTSECSHFQDQLRAKRPDALQGSEGDGVRLKMVIIKTVSLHFYIILINCYIQLKAELYILV